MKLMNCLLVLSCATALALGVHDPSEAGEPCKRAKFDTKLVKDACAAGGVAAAKDAMKKFVKQVKSKQAGLECATCHSKMAPTYDLKPDGLTLYTKLGGQ
ncbi:MAG: hypothetical protein AB7O24_14155 [Kofleriaceae bacterium]